MAHGDESDGFWEGKVGVSPGGTLGLTGEFSWDLVLFMVEQLIGLLAELI